MSNRDYPAAMDEGGAFTFYEFFAGGGMARAGLGPRWRCLFANDIDKKKAEIYEANWGAGELVVKGVADVSPEELPGFADLAWASFPCQDLSLAGPYAGLRGRRSGTFWPFWALMRALEQQRRAPRVVVLENVYGALTSHGGADFAAIGEAMAEAGYRFGALIMDARAFVPQSRPRLFIVGGREKIPQSVRSGRPEIFWHHAVRAPYEKLPKKVQSKWVWWTPSQPPPRAQGFADILEADPSGVAWRSDAGTDYLISLMSPGSRQKLDRIIDMTRASGERAVGALYRRTREGVQRAEIRFDKLAGCLRTAAGGSSRQTILVVEAGKVRSRLLSPREGARLMGLPDSYVLPSSYNQAYHLVGDGVVVPVVRHLAREILEPLLASSSSNKPSLAAA
jgi:DNA (cytosine-5)-methyltransferase 1